ncbi:MAG TPA: hypothetical protein VJN71_00185 [Nitrososphaerales archaeon]|nr:hypothetical protein [Nitrososphaerales archaeon]
MRNTKMIPMEDDGSLPHDEEVKRAAEMREWIESKISELELEVARLRNMLLIVDSTLRRRSFVSAKELRGAEKNKILPKSTQQISKEEVGTREPEARTKNARETEMKELRRTPDGEILANAIVESKRVIITPASNLKLSDSVPPFQSFFVTRILKGYQTKDLESSKTGKISASDVLQYDVKLKEGFISEVMISNYRDKVRLNEILNTATWAFSRMLEKK